MAKAPLTYVFEFGAVDERMRQYIMHEFARHGARHLTLGVALIRKIMGAPETAQKLATEMAAAGLTFINAHAPFSTFENLNVPDPARRGMMLDRLRLVMRIVADMGVRSLVIHTGNVPDVFKDYSLAQLHEALVASLEELMPLAEELDVTIAIENIWMPTNTAAKLLDACQRVNSPYLGICYDAGHANLMKCDRGFSECAAFDGWKAHMPPQWDDQILEKVLPQVTTCHLHDNHGQYDNHLLPGRGTVDWENVASLLRQAPRLKCIECETLPLRETTSISDLCQTMQRLFPGH